MARARKASVSMREFLRTGQFGPMTLGDSADSVRAVLGEPTDWYDPPEEWNPVFLKYGDVEFYFTLETRQLWMIFCDTFKRLHLGPRISLDRWFFDGHPSLETVERELLAEKLKAERRDHPPNSPELYLLHLESGVELYMCNSADSWPGDIGLYGFVHKSDELKP